MSTTTTQGVRCGNHGKDRVYHADRNAVRACFQGVRPISAPPAAPSQPTGPRNADEARSEAMRRLASQTSPFFQDRNMGRPAREYPASEKQIGFLQDLIRQTTEAGEGQDKMLEQAEVTSGKNAKEWIDMLLRVREGQRNSQPKTPSASTRTITAELMTELMGERDERNFCIIDEDGKARFYRISKRGKRSSRPGTWKIQERVSDDLLPRYDNMLVKVGQAIIAQGGAEAAGQRFGELMHRCYECGASLTDTTGNPYYNVGLGPECGAK